MRLRRLAAATAVALLAGTALAACSSGGTGETTAANVVPKLNPDQKVEIVFESYNLTQAGVWTDTVNQLLSEFQTANPNITVKAQAPQGTGPAGSNTVQSVQTQLLAGSAPDVAQLTFDALEFTATQLGAKPISDIVSKEELEEAFGGKNPMHPNARVLADWEGKTVGMPYVFSTPVLFYNATLFASAGLPADVDLSTWDAVEKAGKQISAKTGKPALEMACTLPGGNWCMQGVFQSNGAQVLSDDRKTIEFGSPEAVATVERFAEMKEAGVLSSAAVAAQLENVMKGESAMIVNSSALQGMLLQSAAAGGWKLAAAPLPAFPGKEAVPTNSGSALFVLSSDPAKQRASWELIKFLTSDRAYELISSKIGYLPLRTGLVEEGGALYDWAQSNPLIKPNLEQLNRMKPWVSYPGNSYSQVDTLLANAIEEAIYFGGDAKKLLSEAATRAQGLIK